ncbi:MAG: CPBP family intramembrane glutamic endopeptidase [Cyclobacteriaceae bacterium]
MKPIWTLLSSHVRKDFHAGYYLTVALFLAVALYINYTLDLENSIIDIYAGQPRRVPMYFALYGVTYFIACLITFFFNGFPVGRDRKRFILYALFGVGVLSLSSGWPYTLAVLQWIGYKDNYYAWSYQIANNIMGLLRVAVPLLLFAWWVLPERSEKLGLNAHHLDLKPYSILLLLVLPLVIIASFEPGFARYYPVYQQHAPVQQDYPAWVPMVLYEIGYGLDFVDVELMFRGFFVIGMGSVIGRHAILPMAVLYCSLHFGKPVGEAISSIFGGYLLGLIAYYTRNIWGGIMVHIGLAWMMETVAWIQRAAT